MDPKAKYSKALRCGLIAQLMEYRRYEFGGLRPCVGSNSAKVEGNLNNLTYLSGSQSIFSYCRQHSISRVSRQQYEWMFMGWGCCP